MMTSIATEPEVTAAKSSIFWLYVARSFGDGFAIIILPAYMTALGYDPGTVRPAI
jgi:hypothetical protein